MKYDLLLLDVDGTTVASEAGALPSPAVIAAVGQAREHVHVALATGRPYAMARPVIDALGLDGPGVFNGGAEIVDMSSGKVLESRKIAVPALQEIARVALPFGYDVYNDDEEHAGKVASPKELTYPSAKLFIDSVDERQVAQLLQELNSITGVAAHAGSSWHGAEHTNIHITHELATKFHGVRRLMGRLGIDAAHAIGVADGHNDIPMLEAVGLKVVLGNGVQEAKNMADYIAPSLADDGVADVIHRYILGREGA
jgi:HAD superfamily hydrolase (TIGR01484 family)